MSTEQPVPAKKAKRTRKKTSIQIVALPVVPLRETVALPHMVLPLQIARQKSSKAVEAAVDQQSPVVLVPQRVDSENPEAEDMYPMGVIATLGQVLRLPTGGMQAVTQAQMRAEIVEFVQSEPYLIARVRPIVEVVPDEALHSVETEALMRLVLAQYESYVKLSQNAPAEVIPTLRSIEDPGQLADMAGYTPDLTFEERRQLLETLDPLARLRQVASIFDRLIKILELKSKIQDEVQKGFQKSERDYHLRQQMRAIQKELGEAEPEAAVAGELRDKVEQAGMPDEVREKALHEVDRLAQLPLASPETAVIRNFVDWLVSLPWAIETPDHLDLKEAARVLDEDHYGLQPVKERILEYIAVRKLAEKMRSPILCFVGPPGVGKTSLGRSISRALGRKFVRMSLGGVHDEAEIRGHRRTYVGAMPGRIIQGIRNAGSKNPVFMLDEIDKVGADFRGDPSAALLEVLDPEQNFAFSDHYLEVAFDLSKVIFITTANVLYTIPPALRDRMEVIELSGYTEEEKVEIARRFLVPKQIEQHGLKPSQLRFSQGAIRGIIRHYTKEAGVRNLERELGSVCRKVARRVAEGVRGTSLIRQNELGRYLGPQKFESGLAEEHDEVGVATGVAVTEFGGDLLSIEVNVLEGKPDLLLTGQLGDVMKESARAALTYARAHADELRIAPQSFDNHAIHIHVPAGAIPKDGPSAGITMATALISALTDRPVRRDLAMTGEITLRGRVLPIGGLKQKMLAAHRAGIKTFVMPEKNRKDLAEVPSNVQKRLKMVLVEDVGQVLAEALLPATAPERKVPRLVARDEATPLTASAAPVLGSPIDLIDCE